MSNRSLSRVVVLGATVLGGALAACVGDSPYSAAIDDADAAPASVPEEAGSSSSSSGSTGRDSGSSTPPGDAAALDSSLATDAAMRTDSAPASVACSEESIVSGAYNFRCSASAATITPGGTIPIGTYLLTRYWDTATCGLQIGWGEVFTQDGATYLRYVRIMRVDSNDAAGTTHVGTFRVDQGAAGALDRTEVCDAATLDTKLTGQYEVNTAGAAPLVTLSFADHQERWTKQ